MVRSVSRSRTRIAIGLRVESGFWFALGLRHEIPCGGCLRAALVGSSWIVETVLFLVRVVASD